MYRPIISGLTEQGPFWVDENERKTVIENYYLECVKLCFVLKIL